MRQAQRLVLILMTLTGLLLVVMPASAADSELVEYWQIVRGSWCDLDLPAIKDLAELGAVFRLLAAISWESECIGRGWWPIEELRGYQADLAVALRHLGLVQ